MAKPITIFAAFSALAILSLPAAAADRDIVRTKVVYARYVGHMHYYEAAPWWWHPPYVHRARTNYQPWPYFVRDPDYDRPHPYGVVGFRIF